MLGAIVTLIRINIVMTDFSPTGHTANGFDTVRSIFANNFDQSLEGGAGFYVQRGDEVLVDLIGGARDRKGSAPWETDTLVPVFSCTKAISALVIAWLYENGRLDYDAGHVDAVLKAGICRHNAV